MLKNKISVEWQQLIFIICLMIVPMMQPAIALLLGLAIALFIGHPFIKHNAVFTKWLLQAAVVGLGFTMNLQDAMQAGKTGILFTVVSIAVTIGLGIWLSRLFGINRRVGMLVSGGTAICGGSAIAALGPVVDAKDEDMTIALGTIFILNSIALFIFPPLGNLLGMDDYAFGTWCAIAIHDTSSVVGAAAMRSEEALQVATTTKLIRALWIIPVSLIVAATFNRGSGSKKKITIPWFIFLFVIAMFVSTYIPQGAEYYQQIGDISKGAMRYTLFLIGGGMSVESLKTVGFKPVAVGVILWIVISVLSATVICMMF